MAAYIGQAPAKINLYLAVEGKREDGYHEITSLMCPISLYDEIRVETGRMRLSVTCAHPGVPDGEANLAWRAAELFFARCPVADRVAIDISKRIPVAAGLGGGSSDAAMVLNLLNQCYGTPLSTPELARLGSRIGADVPFFIPGRPAIATGIGDQLDLFPMPCYYDVLLISFPFHVSTAAVYRSLNLGLTSCEKINRSYPFKLEGFQILQHLRNDLERATSARHPEVLEAKHALMDAGADGALMSGSGPTVFGLFLDRAVFRRAADRLSTRPDWRVIQAGTIR